MINPTHLFSRRLLYLLCLILCLIIPVISSLLANTESATSSAARNLKDTLRAGEHTNSSAFTRGVGNGAPPSVDPATDPTHSPPQSPENVGQWSSVNNNVPIVAIHMHLLPNGKVLIFQDDNNPGYPPTRSAGSTKAYVWDVNTDTFTAVDVTTANVFCSGHAFLPDGRLLVTGGHAGQDGRGIQDTFKFDSTNNTWTAQTGQFMEQGRWYPSTVTLGNGEVMVAAGTNGSGGNVPIPEVWKTYNGGGWRKLTGASLNLNYYPYMHLAPNGKVFMAGPEQTTRYLDTTDPGAFSTVGQRVVDVNRDYGSSVMYDVGKVLIVGGGGGCDPSPQCPNPPPPENSAEVIDLNAGSPQWRRVGDMAFRRRQMNATILPDGKVLVTGGSNLPGFTREDGPVLAAELWDPVSEQFTQMASMTKGRFYHSTAVLLPDGRVLSAGSGRPGVEQRNAEFYSPPYLFTTGGAAAVRPTIDSHLSKGVRPGQTLFVTTPDAASVASVTLVRLSSVTHARNMNERFNRLTFTQGLGGLSVTMPADVNACPPGHYMLFILNTNGVPSVAKIISVDSNNSLPPSAPTNLVATATSAASVSLTWSASTGSVDHYEIQRSTSRNGPFTTLIPNPTGTSFTDNAVSSNTTYIYRVRAVDGQGNYSDFSNSDIATTIIFADDPLVVGVTVAKAQHLTELRQAVNAVRAAAALSATTWTDSAPLGVVIQAVHINELRTNLDQARSLLGLSSGSYTDPTLTPGVTVVKAVHVQELRDRVK